MAKKLLVLGSGAALGLFSVSVFSAPVKDAEEKAAGKVFSKSVTEQQRRGTFDTCAHTYDDEIGTDELFMYLPLLRRWLVSKARGQVLELAAGTGRNLQYYDTKKCAVTLIDSSKEMTRVCTGKIKSMGEEANRRMAAFEMNAATLSFNDQQFDTVVQTFGLCSVEDPHICMQEMQRVCKRDGKILLLEHGRSHYGWLNRILDSNVHKHVERWGCYWNRDIEKIVRESGLDITECSRWHFGTTYFIIAKPKAEKDALQ